MSFRRHAAALLLLALGATPAAAADVVCGVGQRVRSELGSGGIGEIAEIGTQSPHVGWYRVIYGYSPSGEWFDPRIWVLHPEGSEDRCVVEATPAAPKPAAPDKPAAAASSAGEGALPSTDRCPAGRRVADRKQQRGTVLGERNGMCVVQLDGGERESYLQWMLSDEGGEKVSADALPAGTYTCSTNGAGFFRITLHDADSYSDRAGKRGSYRFDPASRQLSFGSGSLAGYHSKLLRPGKFGLSGDQDSSFHTVCNLKR